MYPLERSIASKPIFVPSPPWQATQPKPFAAWMSVLYASAGLVKLSTPSAEWQTAQVSPCGCAFRIAALATRVTQMSKAGNHRKLHLRKREPDSKKYASLAL